MQTTTDSSGRPLESRTCSTEPQNLTGSSNRQYFLYTWNWSWVTSWYHLTSWAYPVMRTLCLCSLGSFQPKRLFSFSNGEPLFWLNTGEHLTLVDKNHPWRPTFDGDLSSCLWRVSFGQELQPLLILLHFFLSPPDGLNCFKPESQIESQTS